MMDTSTMKYPFGRCGNCGDEFNSELRNEYHITHCPWCGTKIDDVWSATDSTEEHDRKDDIFCEDCGRRIYERHGFGGDWIDEKAGVCSGTCERELCGDCGDWDEDGYCPACHELDPCGHCGNGGENRNENVCQGCGRTYHRPPAQCEQCGVITDHIVNDEPCCPDCEKELMSEVNPFKGREDERHCHCNNCETKFREGKIVINGDEEHCPSCGATGCIADDNGEEK